MIIDTHCHLDDNSFDIDLDQVLKKAMEVGVKKMIIPGANIKDLPKEITDVLGISNKSTVNTLINDWLLVWLNKDISFFNNSVFKVIILSLFLSIALGFFLLFNLFV